MGETMTRATHWQVQRLPYGKQEIEIKIPQENLLTMLAPRHRPGIEDETAEIRRALVNPIGAPRLAEIAQGKRNAVIVVNDITRPTATKKLLPSLLDELKRAGLEYAQILLLVATGTHRDNTREELESMLGKGILDEFRVYNHHCQDEKNMVKLGTTRDGIPVMINRLFCEAGVKVLTGTIGPHQSAGFSGGRKSVLPGLASLSSLKRHHGFQMRSAKPAMG